MESIALRSNPSDIITVTNVQLGEVQILRDKLIHFEQGIFGFESLKTYAILNIKSCEPFAWCVAIDEPEISFPIVNCHVIYPNYHLQLTDADRELLQLKKTDQLFIFFIVTVDEKKAQVTANLKGPLVFNLEKRLGAQVIMSDEKYVVDYPIVTK